MNPKKSSNFKKEVAQELSVDEDLVDAFVDFYYEKVREALSGLDFPKIYLNNLGTFDLRKRKLEQTISKYKDILGNLQKMTYGGYRKSIFVKDKIILYERALEDINKELEKKKKFKDGLK
jgi:hypothetical protein